MRKNDHYQRTRGRGVEAGGRRKKSGQQPRKVARRNIQKNCGDEREEPAAFITGQIHHELFHAIDNDLPEVLAFGRDHADTFDSQTRHHDEKDHNDPGIDNMGIVMCKVPHTEQLKQLNEKHIGMFHLRPPP